MPNLLEQIRLNNLFDNSPRKKKLTQEDDYESPISNIGKENRLADIFIQPTRLTDSVEMNKPPIGDAVDARIKDTKPSDDEDITSIIERLYKPERTYSDRYDKTLEEMPIRNKPGIGRKIGSSLLGLFGGPEAAEMGMYGGYRRKMADWEEKRKALEPGLMAERAANINERQIATSTASDMLRLRDIQRKEKSDETRLAREKEDSETRRMRADAYVKNLEFRQMNPEMELVAVRGGNYYWTNPQNPNQPPIDTGIKTGTMDRVEELNLQQRQAMARIAAGGAETRATEGVRHVNDLSEITARADKEKEIKNLPETQTTDQEVVLTDAEGKPVQTRRTTTTRTTAKPGFTKMTSPDGKETMDVPNSQVEYYKSKGAKVAK